MPRGFWAWLRGLFRRPPLAPEDGAGVLEHVNAARLAHGLPPLGPSVELAGAAAAHARRMHAAGELNHRLPDEPGLWARLADAGYRAGACGEVIAQGPETAAEVVAVWLEDGAHAAVLLGDYTDLGAARVADYWCADLAAH